jgi:hypothetical protein
MVVSAVAMRSPAEKGLPSLETEGEELARRSSGEADGALDLVGVEFDPYPCQRCISSRKVGGVRKEAGRSRSARLSCQVLDLRKESNHITTLSGHGTALESGIVDQSTNGVDLELGSDPVATGGEDYIERSRMATVFTLLHKRT